MAGDDLDLIFEDFINPPNPANIIATAARYARNIGAVISLGKTVAGLGSTLFYPATPAPKRKRVTFGPNPTSINPFEDRLKKMPPKRRGRRRSLFRRARKRRRSTRSRRRSFVAKRRRRSSLRTGRRTGTRNRITRLSTRLLTDPSVGTFKMCAQSVIHTKPGSFGFIEFDMNTMRDPFQGLLDTQGISGGGTVTLKWDTGAAENRQPMGYDRWLTVAATEGKFLFYEVVSSRVVIKTLPSHQGDGGANLWGAVVPQSEDLITDLFQNIQGADLSKAICSPKLEQKKMFNEHRMGVSWTLNYNQASYNRRFSLHGAEIPAQTCTHAADPATLRHCWFALGQIGPSSTTLVGLPVFMEWTWNVKLVGYESYSEPTS